MERDKLKTQDILVLALAVVTIIVCLLVVIPSFSQRNDMSALVTAAPATPAPTVEPTPEPTAEPTPEPTPEPDLNEEASRAMLDDMTTEEKVWQLFLATPESVAGVDLVTISGDGMQAGLESQPVGGLVYSNDNIEDETQLQEMLAGAQERSRTALFLAYDKSAGSSHITLSGNMRSLGFNLGLDESEDGLIYAAAYSDGMALDGLTAVIMPSDSVTLAADTETSESESGEEASAVPLFLSYDHVAGQLRDTDGFDGLILTPLLKGGIEGYTTDELTVGALAAGCDIICAPDDLTGAVQAVLDAINSGELSISRVNESVQRILLAKLEAGILQPLTAETTETTETATETQTLEQSTRS